jgi:hypothetical protein
VPDASPAAASGQDSTPSQGYQNDNLAVDTMGQLVKQAVPGTKRHSSLQEASVQASALPNAEALSDEEENLNAYVQALDPVPHYSKEGSSGLFYFGQ